ncbi:piggyBac transposable element-derived protein 4-like [Mya arenaria]|nr:piggyBac transposable element-derived protein 4-like [Mya arenaria]
MTMHTNLYAAQFLAEHPGFGQYSRFRKWRETNTAEMKAFVALQRAMGINNKPELEDYWGKYWLTRNLFCDVMSRNRFEQLCGFKHFNDNTTRLQRGQDGYDPLHKVRPVLEIVDPIYPSVYNPGKELALDESMIKYKDRIFFRQYMPTKPTKLGIKTFALCESDTGYGLQFVVYTGRATFPVDQSSPLSMTEQVAVDITKDYVNKGHVLFMDNFIRHHNCSWH